ncbi:tetratricopeptide repeat protein [Desulfitobacterium chlororespirans]|uniref:Tetratricopeptide repeat-containing protein n=1 Tax=Desulfitobacterium chlororespirans DSM 11544 TaxID=1121395 RepID=A0A1M7UGN8_9FIRM|nr:tetratricopeptide repeat protein [Desulfitobacterium chlororespirans]SHN82106.1 Tetratricopeptide repeat-containing protein [Desulfitobacterium chlororespirans DSM 11544]
MRQIQYDLEIIYVYKLYYFFSLLIFICPTSLILGWRFGPMLGLLLFILGFLLAYFLMMHKKSFPTPDKKITARKMAKEITQDSTPLAISHFSSQLYFYFNEKKQAIALLEKYQNTHDPLLCATLADILLREGRPRHALRIVHDNPHHTSDPLLLCVLGHILRQMNEWQAAIRIYELSLALSRKSGFPCNGANRFTQFLLTLSYTATIHHALGDCYAMLKNYSQAKKHYLLGNIRIFDISLWRTGKVPTTHPA